MRTKHNTGRDFHRIPSRASAGAVLVAVTLAVLAVTAVSAQGDPTDPTDRPTRVREAASGLYIHGVTEDLALSAVGRDGVPVLLELLMDADFPRRDNVVAFLHHVGGPETTRALIRFLESPPAPIDRPEEDRAMLLAPRALGRIAARGDVTALNALLDMTAPDADTPFSRAVARGAYGPSMRDDLVESSLHGLALSGAESAAQRLAAIGDGASTPVEGDRRDRVGETARRLSNPTPPPANQTFTLDGPGTTGATDLGDGSGVSTQVEDSNSRSHETPLTFANHPDLTDPMSDAELDTILAIGSVLTGGGDFPADIVCCVSFVRSGSARTWGSSGDGLDRIDDESDISTVLGNNVARVKIAREIDYCSGPGTNIIGCAEIGGNSMVLVRLTTPPFNEGASDEAKLWVHEYGHNTGIGDHHPDDRYIMHASLNLGDSSRNRAVTQSECDSYHSPASGTGMTPTDVGVCHDDDADDLAPTVDNCPDHYNPNQTDTNGDGTGDACEGDADGDGVPDGDDNCPDDHNPGQEDVGDGDGVGDVCDNCPSDDNADQTDRDGDGDGDVCDDCTDADADGYGDPGSGSCPSGGLEDCDDDSDQAFPGAVEVCDSRDNDCNGQTDNLFCDAFDADADGVVDATELAWVGRAFGTVWDGQGTAPWWKPVDFDDNDRIDGVDLSLLGAAWACQGTENVCQ